MKKYGIVLLLLLSLLFFTAVVAYGDEPIQEDNLFIIIQENDFFTIIENKISNQEEVAKECVYIIIHLVNAGNCETVADFISVKFIQPQQQKRFGLYLDMVYTIHLNYYIQYKAPSQGAFFIIKNISII